MKPVAVCLFVALAAFIFLLTPSLAHAKFPDVTAAERALTEVPGSPEAHAVVLFDKGDLTLMDPAVQRLVSVLRVDRRIKVLDEQGVEDFGEVEITHSRQFRLSNLEARTVLPDGTAVEVPKDAVFERRTSRSERWFVTAVAYPSVEPGAILDLSYELRFDSIFYIEPWVFQSEIPTLHSEITYHVSRYVRVAPWGTLQPGREFQTDNQPERDGQRIRVWLTDLPAIPEEPRSVPRADLSAKYMLVPQALLSGTSRTPLLQDWPSLTAIIDLQMYRPALGKDGAVKKKTKTLVNGVQAPRARAEALYRFVRDEIETDPTLSILSVDDKKGVDGVLAAGRGTTVEQALLLHRMLDAAKLESAVVWAPDRSEGRIDPSVANPYWFEAALVRVELPDADGGTVYLDPARRSLTFGALRADHEGQQALVFDRNKPEWVTLPKSSYVGNGRRAVLDLTVGEDGRLTGAGTLTYTGHRATRLMGAGEDEDALVEDWDEYLEARFPGYAVDEVAVSPSVPQRRLEVAFRLAQDEGEVLGDEVTLLPSRPFGPATQPYDLPPERRKTPVQLAYGRWDEVETTVTWPAGWEVEQTPETFAERNGAGSVETAVEETASGDRSVTVRRKLDIPGDYFPKSSDYGALRTLYATLESRDAEPLVLVRR